MNAVYVTCRWSHHDLRLYDKSYEGGGGRTNNGRCGSPGEEMDVVFLYAMKMFHTLNREIYDIHFKQQLCRIIVLLLAYIYVMVILHSRQDIPVNK